MKRAPWRAWSSLVLALASCASAPALEIPTTHPAHPYATESPRPAPSATLALTPPDALANDKR